MTAISTAPAGRPPILLRMKIGVLTAGGDCPGLNAVIRAVTRKALAGGHEVVGLWRGYAGLAERSYVPLDMRTVSGILPLGGTILSTSSYDPYRHDDGVRAGAGRRAGGRVRRRRRDRRGAHDEHHAPAARGRAADGRRPEDDRQRRAVHRLHVRLRHRGADRDRRDRPPAHDGCVPRPRDGDRGDGPQHRLDRGLQRHRGRRRRDRDPGARADASRRSATPSTRGTERGKSFSIVVVAEGAELAFASGEKRQVRASHRDGPVRLSRGSAASARRWAARSRSAPASRRASRRSGTSSAAARPPRRTACSPPATG